MRRYGECVTRIWWELDGLELEGARSEAADDGEGGSEEEEEERHAVTGRN